MIADQEAYQSGIGNLLHMVQCIQSDIAAPGGALAAFCSAPTDARPSSMQFSTLAAQLNVVSPKATRPRPWRYGAIQSSCRALTQGRGSKVGWWNVLGCGESSCRALTQGRVSKVGWWNVLGCGESSCRALTQGRGSKVGWWNVLGCGGIEELQAAKQSSLNDGCRVSGMRSDRKEGAVVHKADARVCVAQQGSGGWGGFAHVL
jgi:hypothetical protein